MYKNSNRDSIAASFGVPYNLYTLKINLRAICKDGSVREILTLEPSDTDFITWKTGYRWANNGWKPFTYSCEEEVSGWCIGGAKKEFAESEIMVEDGMDVLSYSCHYRNSSWQCGCKTKECNANANPKTGGLWQLQNVMQ